MMSGGAALVGEREAGESRRDQDGGDDRRAVCRLRPGGSRREGERDRDARHRPPGPPGCGGRPEHGDEDDHREQRPRQADRVDAMTEGRLERRDERDPERETRDRPEQRADRADDRAVGEQHEPEVLPGRTDRGEHAQLAEPSLSDDGEACGGDERGQQQEDRGHGEHRQRVRPPVAAPEARTPPTRTGFPARRTKASTAPASASTRTVTRSGRPADEGETRANSSLRSRGFSTMPTTVRRRPSRASVFPISSPRSVATPSVTATSSAPFG